jgi:hypothetical protein
MQLLAIIVLVVITGVAVYLSPIILNLAGLPGALIGRAPVMRTSGVGVAVTGHLVVYAPYVLFIVTWTHSSIASGQVFAPIVWLFAFFASVAPISVCTGAARHEARETGIENTQVKAIQISYLAALGLFFFLAFYTAANPMF